MKLDAARKEKVGLILNKAFGQLNEALQRITSFDQKVRDLITRRKAKGLDTSAAESALVVAAQALADAKTAVATISSGATDALSSTTGVSSEALRAQVEKARDAIKNAREKYEAVLKALPKPEPSTASTTPSSNI